jgi:GT2 family glycosyltransferase
MSQEAKQHRAPRVSIVSAVDDHPPDLNVWFEALSSQTLPAADYEVIVVDTTHQLDHDAALKEFNAKTNVRRNISCHRIARGGRARALNHALKLAKGGIVIFLGDDCLPSPEFAEAHVRFQEAHPEPESVGIGSAILPTEFRNPFSVWLEESGQLFGIPVRANMTDVPKTFFYVANASVKRELLEKAGRFDERFQHHAWDDYEFGQRLRAAGMKAQFVPGAPTIHFDMINLPYRERAMRMAGAAAKVYLINNPGKGVWSKIATSPAWRHWLRVAAARLRLAMKVTDGSLISWWRARLDAAFAAGYRKGA